MSAIDVQIVSTDQIIDITEDGGDHEIDVETNEVIFDETRSYNDLKNRPQIEGVTLEGDKSYADLNLTSISNSEIEDLLTLSF